MSTIVKRNIDKVIVQEKIIEKHYIGENNIKGRNNTDNNNLELEIEIAKRLLKDISNDKGNISATSRKE